MFHRNYDLSSILDNSERIYVQTSIDGVNEACTTMVDAWMYVEQGRLIQDLQRELGDHDLIPKTVFNNMRKDMHSGSSMAFTIRALTEIAQDYQGWRISREEANSRREEATRFWAQWRTDTLVPFNLGLCGGAPVTTIGPTLENFLFLRENRSDRYTSDCQNLYLEILNYLGTCDEQRVEVLTDIFTTHGGNYTMDLLNTLKNSLGHKAIIKENIKQCILTANRQLEAAIESGNPTALTAALNPGFYYAEFHNSELYARGQTILNGLLGR